MEEDKLVALLTGVVFLAGSGTYVASRIKRRVKKTHKKVEENNLSDFETENVLYNGVVVNTENSILVLYEQASLKSDVIKYLSVGDMLKVKDKKNGFYEVEIDDSRIKGYIIDDNVQVIGSGVGKDYIIINKKGYVVNVNDFANLRECPTISCIIIESLMNNTILDVIGKQGNWYEIQVEGIIGYMYQTFVGLTTRNIIE
ncbi:MAG: SH3 domain-containing protein [Sarcina sp.]